jgi:acylphosphatase
LRNVDASLTSLAEVKGFRNFVKAQADKIGVTGYIQRYHADDLKLGFEGTEEQCDEFLSWLLSLESDYDMIKRIEPIVDGKERHRRYNKSFNKVTDHSRLKERGGTVHRGPYSDGDFDKISEFSADRSGFFGTRSPV